MKALTRDFRLDTLELKGGSGILGALRGIASLSGFLSSRRSCDILLLFYPDFPFFHPPRRWKIPLLRFLLGRISRMKAATGALFHVDVVDLPRWQAQTMKYELGIPAESLRLAEKMIFGLADRISIPTESMARLLTEDIPLEGKDIKLLPNGLPSAPHTTPAATARTPSTAAASPTRRSGPAFLYAGDLSRTRRRGIEWLIRIFLESAPPGACLHLCGEGGEYLPGFAEGFSNGRLRYWGHLTETECLTLARTCDFGLIPYPEEDYFRWCFPSKLGLYITAGLPVLSTRLDETMRILQKLRIGEARSIDDFASFFADTASLLACYDRASVREACAAYHWSDLVRSAFGPG